MDTRRFLSNEDGGLSMKEERLLVLFLDYLKEAGYKFETEVQFLERKIDVVGKKRKKTMAFELKVKNWKKAFQQTYSTKLCTDFSYMVLFEKYFHNVNINMFKEEELGVILIDKDGKMMKILEPKRSKLINPSLYNEISKKLDG